MPFQGVVCPAAISPIRLRIPTIRVRESFVPGSITRLVSVARGATRFARVGGRGSWRDSAVAALESVQGVRGRPFSAKVAVAVAGAEIASSSSGDSRGSWINQILGTGSGRVRVVRYLHVVGRSIEALTAATDGLDMRRKRLRPEAPVLLLLALSAVSVLSSAHFSVHDDVHLPFQRRAYT